MAAKTPVVRPHGALQISARPFDGYPPELALQTPYGPYRCRVTAVEDGDTCWCLVNPGFRIGGEISFRFPEFNAPETRTGTTAERVCGRAARQTLLDLLPPSGFARVHTDRAVQAQSFDRWIGRIEIILGVADGRRLLVDVNAALRYAQRRSHNWGLGWPTGRNWYGNDPLAQQEAPDPALDPALVALLDDLLRQGGIAL